MSRIGRRAVLGCPAGLVSWPLHAAETLPVSALNSATLPSFRDSSAPLTFRLPPGRFECTGLALPSHARLIGSGQGATVLCAAREAEQPMIVNANTISGDSHIEIINLTVDGRGADQRRSVNGVVMDRVSDSRFEIEVRNCSGSGFLLSGGLGNSFGPGMHCHGNGRRFAGYGLYIFGSSNNAVDGGKFDDNCIGIAVEASRIGGVARNNRIARVRCFGNRADFGQSGAGIHFEQSLGGVCDGVIEHAICICSTGVGINNTACALRIVGGRCADNRESGVATVAGRNIDYDGLICERNALGASNGYRAELRFDDTDLSPGTTGRVANCRLRGAAPDGGMKTMSVHSRVNFLKNDVGGGYRFPFNLHGRGDRLI